MVAAVAFVFHEGVTATSASRAARCISSNRAATPDARARSDRARAADAADDARARLPHRHADAPPERTLRRAAAAAAVCRLGNPQTHSPKEAAAMLTR